MNILVIGSGGREHALAWALARSPQTTQIFVAPGNGGTAWPGGDGRCPAYNLPIKANDIAALLAFAQTNEIGLTVVGPEQPLAEGVVDAFQVAGLTIFGPMQAAAQLEASKAFAKQFMARHGLPTAKYASFEDAAAAEAYLNEWQGPVVVKASGLAAGKGVIVCDDAAQAVPAVRQMLVEGAFGAAGQTVLLEERLTGPELSLMAFCDGRTVRLMPPARDHKRVFDHDAGPNTGGMGAFAPVPELTGIEISAIGQLALQAAVDGMAADGVPYVGVLYAGLMLTPDGPKLLEYNCRFGDPETQVVLPLLASDLVELLLACCQGRLAELEVNWRDGACATVVMAAPGYPGSYPTGAPIHGLDAVAQLDDLIVFQAGTARQAGQIVTAGGRVLAVSGLGATVEAAVHRAYDGVAQVQFSDAHYRRDIGSSSQSH
jgi:phosphoribosylamine---glycine ligase